MTRVLERRGVVRKDTLAARRDWFLALLDLLRPRARSIDDIVDQAIPYLDDEVTYEEAAVGKHWKRPGEVVPRLQALRDRYADLDDWNADTLEAALRGLADEMDIGAGKLIHPLRVALLGTAVSPGIFDVILAVGREASLQRLDRAIAALDETAADDGDAA